MPKLSGTQLVILGAAAQRTDLAVLPLPDSVTLKGGALNKVMDSLRNRGLIRVTGADAGCERVVVTGAGMAAIGVEQERDEEGSAGAAKHDTPPTSADSTPPAADAQAPTSEGNSAATPAAGKPTPRAGTKQGLMIEMLKRPEGATVEQIAAATGWQHHTIRGAISGALKKKLGLTIETRRSAPTAEVGRDETGAKASSTVYRITGSGTELSNGSATAIA
jgi:hypothetical protein